MCIRDRYGLEYQTDPDPFAPIRLIGYDGASYRGQLAKRGADKSKYPVITIVLYFGLKRWNKPTHLYECVKIPEILKPFVNDYRINLVEVAFLDEQLDHFHSDFRIIAEYFINKRKNIEYIPSPQEIRHVDEFLKLMQALEGDDRYEEVLHTLQAEEKKEGIKMSEVLDRVEKRGREKMAHEINTLYAALLEQNRMDDLKRAITDTDYQRQLLSEYGISDDEE